MNIAKQFFLNKIALVGLLFTLCCIRLSYWQWTRHLEKKELIQSIKKRFIQPVTPLHLLLQNIEETPELLETLALRRTSVTGTFDYEHEIVIRNRRYEEIAGVFILTPLKIKGRNDAILVSRGFAPLSYVTNKKLVSLQKEKETISLTGLIKIGSERTSFFGPREQPLKPNEQQRTSWIRIDIPEIQKQVPYSLAPFYIERMEGKATTPDTITDSLVQSSSGKSELLTLVGRAIPRTADLSKYNFPVPVFSTYIPPGRHLGYVYEWLIIGFGGYLICCLIGFTSLRKRT